MQVTHEQDHVTHAVIAPAETIEFGISNSAEFFQILSSTLYTDQKLAVVREVLCNAWDAHIAAGRTDDPILISLNDKQLVIRDFGLGIPQELIGEIYGTYGNSTKKNDGNQTGGFGLGCKAPFAYTDHFEVESFCQGKRTIYAISKSSAERHGKPGITPIVTLPTTETGLRVSIPIRSADRYTFEHLIRKIVRNGEMLARLDNVELETLPFSKAEDNWLIVRNRKDLGDGRIFVRYGNVIYPIPHHHAYSDHTRVVDELLVSLSSDYHEQGYALILQALPHSISVTPSRESLSLQEHTINALASLLKGFASSAPKMMFKYRTEIARQVIDEAVTANRHDVLFDDRETLPFGDVEQVNKAVISTYRELTQQRLFKSYPNDIVFRREDFAYRLTQAQNLNLGWKGHISQVKTKLLSCGTNKAKGEQPHKWFMRKIVGKLHNAMYNDPVMDHRHLYILNPADSFNKYGLVEASTYRYNNWYAYLPLLRNIVVLAFSRADLVERVKKFPEMQNASMMGIFVYMAPRKLTQVQQMRDFFLKRGFTLLDLTVPQPWDKPKLTRPKRIAKPPVTDYPALSGCKGQNTYRVDLCFQDTAPRMANPKCYIEVEYSRAEFRLFSLLGFSKDASIALTERYGSVCAVVRTKAAADKLKALGLPTLSEFMFEDILNELKSNPNWSTYWPESVELALGTDGCIYDPETLDLAAVLHQSSMRTALGLTTQLTIDEQRVLKIWQQILQYGMYYDNNKIKLVRDPILATQLGPVMQALQNSKIRVFYQVLNISKIKKLFEEYRSNPTMLQQLTTIIKTAFIG